MKRFFTIILTILLAIGAVSGTIALARQLKNEVKTEQSKNNSTSTSSDTPTKDDSSVDESIDVTQKDGLIVPENESARICDGLEMATGAQLYLGADSVFVLLFLFRSLV